MQLRLRVPFWLVRPEDFKVSYGLRQRSALRADNRKSDWQMSRAGDSRARASGRGRRSRRPRNRLGKQDLVGENLEEISPGGHKKQGQGFAHFCKEARAHAGDCSRLLPEIFRRFGDSVEGEGEKIKGGEDGGQVFPAMPEIMFEVITFRFQDVEALVLDLPSGAA